MFSQIKRYFSLGFTAQNVSLPIEQAGIVGPKDKGSQFFGIGAGFLAFAGMTASAIFPILLLLLIIALMDVLRKRQNPMYWQIACWVLVTLGILARQLYSHNHQLDLKGLSPSLILSSEVIALAVLPAIMWTINKTRPGPNILQVAVPFSLGFFLDYGQVLASTYVIHLPWVHSA